LQRVAEADRDFKRHESLGSGDASRPAAVIYLTADAESLYPTVSKRVQFPCILAKNTPP